MSVLSAFLFKQRMRWHRRGIDRSHDLRRRLAYYVREHGFEIGDYSAGEPTIRLYNTSKLKVGKYCSIAAGALFIMGGGHRTDTVTTHRLELGHGLGSPVPDIVIGSDVWIAGNAVILSDVTIGDGAVVGAGSVVIDDVPPYSIVFGNPARVFGRRFSDDLVAALLELHWWDLNHKQVQLLRPLLLSTSIELFIDECRKLKGLPPAARSAVAGTGAVKPMKIVDPGDGSTEGSIRDWCAAFLAKELKVPLSQIDPAAKFTRMGIDSTTSIIFSVDLGEWLGFELSSDLMFDYPTINDLARHLATQCAGRRLDRHAS